MTIQEAHKLIYDDKEGLGFCGCGRTDDAVRLVRLVLLIQQSKRNINVKGDEHTKQYYHYQKRLEKLMPNKGVYYFVLYTLDSKGFTEHGGMVDNSWLSEKGEAFLEVIEKWGIGNVTDIDNVENLIEEFGEAKTLDYVNKKITINELYDNL